MVPLKLSLATAPFMALVLVASLQGLAASGHFPRGAKADRSGPGPAVLFRLDRTGGRRFCGRNNRGPVPLSWYAAVIGGGLCILVAPLVLQFFPDRFVDNSGRLHLPLPISFLRWFWFGSRS
jgi:hypothetical protein